MGHQLLFLYPGQLLDTIFPAQRIAVISRWTVKGQCQWPFAAQGLGAASLAMLFQPAGYIGGHAGVERTAMGAYQVEIPASCHGCVPCPNKQIPNRGVDCSVFCRCHVKPYARKTVWHLPKLCYAGDGVMQGPKD